MQYTSHKTTVCAPTALHDLALCVLGARADGHEVIVVFCCCADIIEMQAVDRDLFSFVLQLLQHSEESTHRKLRRTEPSASSSPVRQATNPACTSLRIRGCCT